MYGIVGNYHSVCYTSDENYNNNDLQQSKFCYEIKVFVGEKSYSNAKSLIYQLFGEISM